MSVELINPIQIIRCVTGDVCESPTWKAIYHRVKRTPWYLRIFNIYKDKYEWVIYNRAYYGEWSDKHPCWFFPYYISIDKFNKEQEGYFCDENWIVSRKAYVKLYFSDGSKIYKYFYDNAERDKWLSNFTNDVPLIDIDAEFE